ncbi:hypothetical protein JVT61DRAFT_4774 [Boletus reticuloceps]|uniref:Serine-threonine/tyrosine-protein kinase catalytic domain-containing protein n=1 Tax=Boletus reticuloceps TaxID=495285 RepID=A0A8I2YLK5_9AGAM|nr:hypothetical protein JVT61DRAFT_4774 [Boletus reticuloceps]
MAFCLADLTCCLKDSYEEEVKEHISPVSLTGDWTHLPSITYWDVLDEGKSTLESSNEHDKFTAYWPSYYSSLHDVTIRVPVEKVHKEERNEYSSSWPRRPASGVRICHWSEGPFGASQRVKLSVVAKVSLPQATLEPGKSDLTIAFFQNSVGIVHGKGILNTLALSQPTRMSRTGESLVGDVTDAYGARWAATEFFRLDNGDPRPTKMSDVYSFACLMLQVLTGNVPYCATKRPEQVVYLKYLGREPIDAKTPEVGDRYVAFMRWCWSPVPEKRPCMETVVDFIEEEINKLEE